ncbi:unnamed protein product [Dovyalis caffra]|uniref:UDP-glycosyltransferase n=1 Tax=Dovyalis caffra TaxID=77055 RepID=A0AAV1R4J5_9ROSI|nr:unnamed protein product [Dovyalis caffra]
MSERKQDLVMFPFMAQGHIIPFLALALQLEQNNNYTITFVNTYLTIKKLKSSLPANSSIQLSLKSLSMAQAMACLLALKTLTQLLTINILQASSILKPSFKKLFSDLVRVQNGFGFACYQSSWLNLRRQNKESDESPLPDFLEASTMLVTQLEMEELDKLGLIYFRRKLGKPVWPIELVLLSKRSQDQAGITPENTISATWELQASGKNFIWDVKPPVGFDLNLESKAKG